MGVKEQRRAGQIPPDGAGDIAQFVLVDLRKAKRLEGLAHALDGWPFLAGEGLQPHQVLGEGDQAGFVD